MDSTTHASEDKREKTLFHQLAMPFPTSKLKLRVLHYNREKTRALVCPSVSKSTVIDRLNTVCGLTGWRPRFQTQTITNVTRRVRDNETILTGKVLITCQLEIAGIGVKESTGEMWADDKNACTSAEAQSLKRAASRFGVGLYLEGVENVWLPVDGQGRLSSDAMIPLPDYALLDEEREAYKRKYAAFKARLEGRQPDQRPGETRAPAGGKTSGRAETRRPQTDPGRHAPQQHELDKAYVPFRGALGHTLLHFVISETARCTPSGISPGGVRARTVENLTRTSSMMKKTRSLAEIVPEADFFAALDQHKIERLTDIPNVETLRSLHKALTDVYKRLQQGRSGTRAA